MTFRWVRLTVLVTFGCVLVAAGCGGQTVPTAPSVVSPLLPAAEPATRQVVSGLVTAASTGHGLYNARVLITLEDGRGSTTFTDGAGRYSANILAGPFTIAVELNGFAPQQRRLESSPPPQDFALVATVTPVLVAGDWTVTFFAASSCRGVLPDVAMQRTYDVTMIQDEVQIVITFRSPSLETRGRRPWGEFVTIGLVLGDRLSFAIPGDTDEGTSISADFIDHLSPTEELGLMLGGAGTVGASEIRTTMDGPVQYWPGSTSVQLCRAPDHAFVFRRK